MKPITSVAPTPELSLEELRVRFPEMRIRKVGNDRYSVGSIKGHESEYADIKKKASKVWNMEISQIEETSSIVSNKEIIMTTSEILGVETLVDCYGLSKVPNYLVEAILKIKNKYSSRYSSFTIKSLLVYVCLKVLSKQVKLSNSDEILKNYTIISEFIKNLGLCQFSTKNVKVFKILIDSLDENKDWIWIQFVKAASLFIIKGLGETKSYTQF